MQSETESSPLVTIVTFSVIAVAIIVSGVILLITRPEPVSITILPPEPTATPLPTNTPSPLIIYVTGAVVQSGAVITVPAGSRVQDAVALAGGATGGADLTRVNLADTLRDGDQVHVPVVGELPNAVGAGVVDPNAAVAGELNLATPGGGNLVGLNSATSEELQTLPRIGPSIAARIIEYRELNGPFTSLDDLDNVSGIGPATLEQLAPLVIFD